MKIRLLQITLSTLTLMSCGISRSDKKLSSEEIISKSIQFHDPHKHWNTFHATMNFESSFSWNDSIPEHLELTFNNSKQYFNYLNHDRDINLKYYSDSCTQLSDKGSCEGYAWTYGFYPYVCGLPMKLKDPGITPETEFKKTVLKKMIL